MAKVSIPNFKAVALESFARANGLELREERHKGEKVWALTAHNNPDYHVYTLSNGVPCYLYAPSVGELHALNKATHKPLDGLVEKH